MRPSCPKCCTKHLAQAAVLLQEAHQGHAEHRWLAVGHLAEAADEILAADARLAESIRRARKVVEDGGSPDLTVLLARVPRGDAAPPAPASGTATKQPCKNCGGKTLHPATPRAIGPADDGSRDRVVVMTGFSGWSDVYSLCAVVRSQVRHLLRSGFAVHLWARQGCPPPTGLSAVGTRGTLHWSPVLPVTEDAQAIAGAIRQHLDPLGPCSVLVHDLLFQADHEHEAEALHTVANGDGPDMDREWFFWCHSGFGERGHDAGLLYRMNLPKGRCTIVTPGEHLRAGAAAYYGCEPRAVAHVPNILHPCEVLGWSHDLEVIATKTMWLTALRTFVLPVADGNRLKAKGAEAWIDALCHISAPPLTVCGVLAVGQCDTDAHRANLAALRERARRGGLHDDALVFTPELLPHTATTGLRRADVRELLRMSTALYWPSQHEADPLVVREAEALGLPVIVSRPEPAWAAGRDVFTCAPNEIGDAQMSNWNGRKLRSAAFNGISNFPLQDLLRVQGIQYATVDELARIAPRHLQ